MYITYMPLCYMACSTPKTSHFTMAGCVDGEIDKESKTYSASQHVDADQGGTCFLSI